MTMRVAIAAVVLLAVAAAPASAATLRALKPCYVSTGSKTTKREDVVVHGDAFEPEAMVEVLVDGVVAGTAPTDAIGTFELVVDAPFQPTGERTFAIVARDTVNALTAEARVTKLNVRVRPRRANASQRVRFIGRGFMQSGPVYAHYLYGGREQKRVRMVRRTRGACGTFVARRRQIPIEQPQNGEWTVQFDQKRVFSQQPDPVWVRLPITVSEVFREP
jgi:hypothetical protein